jgi:hypothetical protein
MADAFARRGFSQREDAGCVGIKSFHACAFRFYLPGVAHTAGHYQRAHAEVR